MYEVILLDTKVVDVVDAFDVTGLVGRVYYTAKSDPDIDEDYLRNVLNNAISRVLMEETDRLMMEIPPAAKDKDWIAV